MSLSVEDVYRQLHELAFDATLQTRGVREHVQMATAVAEALSNGAADSEHAPRRPKVLGHVMRAAGDAETSRRELALLIGQDPALAGNLLKLANTPLYRVNTKPVESVDRAVAVMGANGIRSLIAVALMQPVFRANVGAFSRFPGIAWDHTLRSAAAGEVHAALVENSDPFAAQLLGLLMGLGTLIVFRVALDEYARRPLLAPQAGVMAALVDHHAASVAWRVAEQWEVSGRILAGLEDQMPDRRMQEPSSFGRSLAFGRLIGALAVLRGHGQIDDAACKALMRANGGAGVQFERLWERLTSPSTES